jgi:hypothetical protein
MFLGAGVVVIGYLIPWDEIPKILLVLIGLGLVVLGLWALRERPTPPLGKPEASAAIKSGNRLRTNIAGLRTRGGGIATGDDSELGGSDYDIDVRSKKDREDQS